MRVFVSWSGKMAEDIADSYQHWLAEAFPKRELSVFFTPKNLKPGDRWRDIIRRRLSNSDVGVIFLTRESLASPWVLFEAGAIAKALSSSTYPVLIDVGVGDLPAPFEQFQATNARDRDNMWDLTWAIREKLRKAHGKKVSRDVLEAAFGAWWPRFSSKVHHRLGGSLSGGGDWALVSPARVAHQIADSPFQARDVFRVARRHVDLVAQNHYFITVDHEEEHLEIVREFLSKAGRRVDLMLMDPKATAAVQAWTELMTTSHFPKDLDAAVDALLKWLGIAKAEKWSGSLEVRMTGLIATSQTFFDRETPNGVLLLVPMINKPSNADRCTFYISKKANRGAFDSYRTAHIERWRRARVLGAWSGG